MPPAVNERHGGAWSASNWDAWVVSADADHLQAPGGATETERDGFGGVAIEEALSEGAIDRDAAVRRISLEAVNEGDRDRKSVV